MSPPRDDRLRRVRRERLLGLLPRIYRAQPEGSTVWALLDALAGQLAALDEATEQVLRDRWIALAGGEPRFTDGPHPVDLLGQLAGIWREDWETARGDDANAKDERFRRRVRQTAPVLLHGATTSRGVMTVAAAALDAELCRRALRVPVHSDGANGDTTLGWGVRPGTVASCDGCKDPTGRCQYEEGARASRTPIVARFELTDNPITLRSLRLTGIANPQNFFPRNASLAADRPTVTLEARTTLVYPALENSDTGEVLLFAGTLNAGDVLTIRSGPPANPPANPPPDPHAAERLPFRSHEWIGPAAVPSFATALRVSGDMTHDVSAQVFYLRGEVFDRAQFVGEDGRGPRFAELSNLCRTPLLEPGEPAWVFRTYSKRDIGALGDAQLRAILLDGAPTQKDKGTADLTLTWWSRPPATFRLTVRPLAPVSPGRDEVAALQNSVERARAGGVYAIVSVPEQVALGTSFEELAGADDRTFTAGAAWRTDEYHELAERQPLFGGAFDTTRFGSSRFG